MRIATPWTEEEDQLLRDLVVQHGRKWTAIARYIDSKGSKQCRRRWRNVLNADLKCGGWTPEEDQILTYGHLQYGNRWTEIAKMVGGRTDNAVKNRWAALRRRDELAAAGTIVKTRRRRPYNVPKGIIVSEGGCNHVLFKQSGRLRTLCQDASTGASAAQSTVGDGDDDEDGPGRDKSSRLLRRNISILSGEVSDNSESSSSGSSSDSDSSSRSRGNRGNLPSHLPCTEEARSVPRPLNVRCSPFMDGVSGTGPSTVSRTSGELGKGGPYARPPRPPQHCLQSGPRSAIKEAAPNPVRPGGRAAFVMSEVPRAIPPAGCLETPDSGGLGQPKISCLTKRGSGNLGDLLEDLFSDSKPSPSSASQGSEHYVMRQHNVRHSSCKRTRVFQPEVPDSLAAVGTAMGPAREAHVERTNSAHGGLPRHSGSCSGGRAPSPPLSRSDSRPCQEDDMQGLFTADLDDFPVSDPSSCSALGPPLSNLLPPTPPVLDTIMLEENGDQVPIFLTMDPQRLASLVQEEQVCVDYDQRNSSHKNQTSLARDARSQDQDSSGVACQGPTLNQRIHSQSQQHVNLHKRLNQALLEHLHQQHLQQYLQNHQQIHRALSQESLPDDVSACNEGPERSSYSLPGLSYTRRLEYGSRKWMDLTGFASSSSNASSSFRLDELGISDGGHEDHARASVAHLQNSATLPSSNQPPTGGQERRVVGCVEDMIMAAAALTLRNPTCPAGDAASERSKSLAPNSAEALLTEVREDAPARPVLPTHCRPKDVDRKELNRPAGEGTSNAKNDGCTSEASSCFGGNSGGCVRLALANMLRQKCLGDAREPISSTSMFNDGIHCPPSRTSSVSLLEMGTVSSTRSFSESEAEGSVPLAKTLVSEGDSFRAFVPPPLEIQMDGADVWDVWLGSTASRGDSWSDLDLDSSRPPISGPSSAYSSSRGPLTSSRRAVVQALNSLLVSPAIPRHVPLPSSSCRRNLLTPPYAIPVPKDMTPSGGRRRSATGAAESLMYGGMSGQDKGGFTSQLLPWPTTPWRALAMTPTPGSNGSSGGSRAFVSPSPFLRGLPPSSHHLTPSRSPQARSKSFRTTALSAEANPGGCPPSTRPRATLSGFGRSLSSTDEGYLRSSRSSLSESTSLPMGAAMTSPLLPPTSSSRTPLSQQSVYQPPSIPPYLRLSSDHGGGGSGAAWLFDV